jgi:hypothetical protein
MADKSWQRKFEDPISLPGDRKLVTLRDAADYITSLPTKESDLPEWQTAIEVLMLVSRIHELERYMRCRDCSQVRGYAYKRSHLVALRPTKISASDCPACFRIIRRRLCATPAERELVLRRWGMPPPLRKGGPPVTNIRNVSQPSELRAAGILSTGTSKKLLWHRHFLNFRRAYFCREKSLKIRFGCIFGCSWDC